MVCLVVAVLGLPLYAQEETPEGQQAGSEGSAPSAAPVDPRAGIAALAKALGYIMPGEVTTPLGRITLNGMFVGGLTGYMENNTALDKTDQLNNDDEDWVLQPFDSSWQANFAKVSLTYNNGNYGGYFMFSAEDWDGNPEKNYRTGFSVPYAFVWRSFFDNRLKLSLGKLYGENYQTRERVWKAEGATSGGWSFSENYKYNMQFRLEYKPIDGLNVGFQWDFLPAGQTDSTGSPVPNMLESLKEIGIAGEYKNDLFNVVAGVRFDGADGMNKFDTYTYLKDYYGEWGYVGNSVQNDYMPAGTLAPHWKYGDEVYGTKGEKDGFTTANADKPFDGSHRLLFGFNYKGVKNLTAKMQASFWNLGDFDRFGTGSFDETFSYAVTPKFNAGINLYQDFYGSDAFPDNMINSPYFRFEPTVSYQLTPNINASLLGTIGICQDVVESDWRIKPSLVFNMGGFGAFRVELSYELQAITYTEKALEGVRTAMPGYGNIPVNGNIKMRNVMGGDPIYKNYLGLSCMWMF
jgi:hypothetical protein